MSDTILFSELFPKTQLPEHVRCAQVARAQIDRGARSIEIDL